MSKFIPDIYQKSIYDIDYKKLKKMNIKCLAFDLDNTIAPYNEDVPSNELKELFNILTDDFKVIIFSNASKKRVTPFKELLNVDSAYRAKKPFQKRYQKVMRIYHLKPEAIAFIGDQIITDILGANKNGSVSVLVNPIGTYEPVPTRINRFFERGILNNFKKKGILEKGVYYD